MLLFVKKGFGWVEDAALGFSAGLLPVNVATTAATAAGVLCSPWAARIASTNGMGTSEGG